LPLDDLRNSALNSALDGSMPISAHIGVRNSVLGLKLKGFDGSRLGSVLDVLGSSTFGSTLDGSRLGLALDAWVVAQTWTA
jgi:hypothetical protein